MRLQLLPRSCFRVSPVCRASATVNGPCLSSGGTTGRVDISETMEQPLPEVHPAG